MNLNACGSWALPFVQGNTLDLHVWLEERHQAILVDKG